jgi:hypothetical protein
MRYYLMFSALLLLIMAPTVYAMEVDVQGVGKADITADVVTVQAMAKNEALKMPYSWRWSAPSVQTLPCRKTYPGRCRASSNN